MRHSFYIFSLKHNIINLGENWGHVILCEKKNEQHYQTIINALKLPNLKLMPIMPSDVDLDQLNGFLFNKQFLNNFKDNQIYIYDNISTLNNLISKNKLVLKFELNF